ncbi:hypothetical protein HanOQP8_Chr01g0017191 [Helianthus annuus]|nr:hypothetical protein HanOQP8_Chr01g0017191 [Helianthus annuus]
MLLGFISLLLTVSQSRLVKICVKESLTKHLLPCSLSHKKEASSNKGYEATSHIRHLLAEEATTLGYCASKVTNLDHTHHYYTPEYLRPKERS